MHATFDGPLDDVLKVEPESASGIDSDLPLLAERLALRQCLEQIPIHEKPLSVQFASPFMLGLSA